MATPARGKPIERCHAAVPRRWDDYVAYNGNDWPFEKEPSPFELVADQCRRAASTTAGTYPVCATHAANHDGGFIYPAAPFVGKGHWEWVVDD